MNIAVVISTFNGEKYVEEQILSIINQSILPDTLYVYDDCSTDSTFTILENLRGLITGKGIRYILEKNERNKGYKKSFKDALMKTNEDIVFLSDQDDIWYFDKIKEMSNIFLANPDILSLSSSYQLVDEEGGNIDSSYSMKFKNNGNLSRIDIVDFVRSPRYPGMTMAVRKELIKELPNYQCDMAHDWVLNVIAAAKKGFYFFDKKLVAYRQSGNNTVGTIQTADRKTIEKKRLNTIADQKMGIEVCEKYFNNLFKAGFLFKCKTVLEKRKKYISKKNLLKEILLYSFNFNYMSRRCFLGDAYAIIKCKNKK